MNRRGFILSLFKTAVVATISPSIINDLNAFANTRKVTVVMYEGKEYWIDWAMWKAEQEFMRDMEQRMFEGHRPLNINEL
jgi:hypothetical protein